LQHYGKAPSAESAIADLTAGVVIGATEASVPAVSHHAGNRPRAGDGQSAERF